MVVATHAASAARSSSCGAGSVGAAEELGSSVLPMPVTGDLVWRVPMLATLNPTRAPIAHVGRHVGSVAHDYDNRLSVDAPGRSTSP
jgi:hypothetical protein